MLTEDNGRSSYTFDGRISEYKSALLSLESENSPDGRALKTTPVEPPPFRD